MTGRFIPPPAIKDILMGIFYSLLIILVMYTIPLIGLFAWVVLPLPILFYRLKIGRAGSAVIMAANMTILIILSGSAAFNILYFGSLLITGFLLGECIEKHLPVEKVMLFTCLGLIGLFCASILLYSASRSQGIDQVISGYTTRYEAVANRLFSESAQLYPDVDLDRQLFEEASRLFMLTFPGIILSIYMTMALLNVLFIRRLLNKKGIVVQTLENLSRWRAPDKLVLALIGLSVLLFLPIGGLKIISINCLILLSLVYFFQGMAVVSFFFKKKNVPFAIKSFFYILIAIQPIFLIIVVGCGLFDTWINFRRLDADTTAQ